MTGACAFSRLPLLMAAALLMGVFTDAVQADATPERAVMLDPFDPVPQIDFSHRTRHHHDDRRDDKWNYRGQSSVIVDCSGRRYGAFRSISEAARHVRPNGEIRIVPASRSVTCVESVSIFKPVRIVPLERDGSGYGSGPIVIQAPDNQSCLIADIALGDRLRIEGVQFIGRGHRQPCVSILAGHVDFEDVVIDSRRTDWAFDVGDSGTLSARHVSIETDGSGIFASRAAIDLIDVSIKMESGREGKGLSLRQVDGRVEELRVVGGDIALDISSGSDGISLSQIRLFDSNVGMHVRREGGQGPVILRDLYVYTSETGLIIDRDARVDLAGGEIVDSRHAAIAIEGGVNFVSNMQIARARYGIWLGGGEGRSDISGNVIKDVSRSAIHVAGPGEARITANTLICQGDAKCFGGSYGDGVSRNGNSCSRRGIFAPRCND